MILIHTDQDLNNYKKEIQSLIDSCFVQDINPQIKTLTKEIMQSYPIRVPDAIVSASSIYLDMPLFTFDTDFKKNSRVRIIAARIKY